MKKKNLQIFSINKNKTKLQNSAEFKVLFELRNLLKDSKFEEIIPISKKGREQYPKNYFFYTIGAIAHSMKGENDTALKILFDATERFPNEFEVYFHLGNVHQNLEEFNKANKAFKKSYGLTPKKYNVERSDCLNELGNNYLVLKQKDEAIKQWELAVKENPNNFEAQDNLRYLTNEFDEPTAISPEMEDVLHFQSLQMEKYFDSQKKTDLSNEDEAKNVVGLIMEKWDEVIIPQKDKLNSMTTKQKTEWFNSVEIDFNKETSYNFPSEFDEEFNNDLHDELFDDEGLEQTIFAGLLDEEILMVPFTFPFLKAMGILEMRIDALFMKEVEPIDYERELIDWALVIVNVLFEVVLKNTTGNQKLKLIDEAIEIAEEELEDKLAKETVYIAIDLIKNVVADGKKSKKPMKKKRRKRKKR